MFTYKSKNLVIPQREHARLAGNIAVYWGNKHFDLPRIPLSTVVKGITFHQNGYDTFDINPVGEMSEDILYRVFENDFNVDMKDQNAELVNMFHQFRLVNGKVKREGSEKFKKLKEEFNQVIQTRLKTSKFREKDFLWTNRITHLCDKVSFNFCMENKVEEIVPLYIKTNSQVMQNSKHRLVSENTVQLDSWPFSIREIKSVVIGYEKLNYPNHLIPHLLQVKLVPMQ